jgi:hypothetical protein
MKRVIQIVLLLLLISGAIYGQEKNDNIKQKYEFENNDIKITLDCNSQYLYENDSCLISFAIKNKMKKDIYIIDETKDFKISLIENKLINATIEFGGDFDGAIDYVVYLKRIKPNTVYSNKATLFYDELTKYNLINNINIRLSLGYLDNIDSLNNHYPKVTSIKSEKISEDILKTSAYALYIYWKQLSVGSLSIKFRKTR